jgi:hypothetical protein
MSAPRRRLIRATPIITNHVHPRRLQRLQTRLERERDALHRWMARLKRAFHAVEKGQRIVARLEQQITRLEGGRGP